MSTGARPGGKQNEARRRNPTARLYPHEGTGIEIRSGQSEQSRHSIQAPSRQSRAPLHLYEGAGGRPRRRVWALGVGLAAGLVLSGASALTPSQGLLGSGLTVGGPQAGAQPPLSTGLLASIVPSVFPSLSGLLGIFQVSAPPPALEKPSLELDLELDNPTRILDQFHHTPSLLDACWKTNSELLLAYGHALRATGKLDSAVNPLKHHYENKGVLGAYAALMLGELALERKQPGEAWTWFQEATLLFPGGERNVDARLGAGIARLRMGEAKEAVQILETLLNSAPKSGRRHEVRLALAEAYEANGQLEKAVEAYEWLWAWVPTLSVSEQAARELARFQEQQLGGYTGALPVVRYRRALQLLKGGQVETGLTLMQTLAQDSSVTAQLPRRFSFELARAYFQAKQYSDAAEQLDAWYSRTRNEERAEALFWRAMTQGRMGRYEEAISLYRLLARAYPKSPNTETALMKIGMLRLDEGSFAEAEEAFTLWRDRYPKSSSADNAWWYIGWTQLRQGKYSEAVTTFQELLRRFPRSGLVPGVRYWLARTAVLQGNKEAAIQLYQQVLQSSQATHYAPLAELQLEALGQPVELKRVSGNNPEPPPALQLPHPEILERITALTQLGLRSQAQEELSLYEHQLKGRDELLAMADWHRKTDNFYGARRIISNLGLGEGVPRIGDPGLRWQFSYPMAFRDHLSRISLPESVPIELIYAIMRQESEFQPWATSRVGARGLMQVMPETAREVCSTRKVAAPNLKQMYRPEISVLHGAWHLEDLMKRLGGRLPLVIGAYNAGPEAVERWMKERPVDPIDVFMEEISYTETRRYVRKVLTNLWTYRRLYGDGHTPLRLEPKLQLPIAASRMPRGRAQAAEEDENGTE